MSSPDRDQTFAFTRMGTEAGEPIQQILARKEAERAACGGWFGWGIGNSLGENGPKAGDAHGGTLPILFAHQTSAAKAEDAKPGSRHLWTAWMDGGVERLLPSNMVITSKRTARRYGLFCYSDSPIDHERGGFLDSGRCRTVNGRSNLGQLVVALLTGDPQNHGSGDFRVAIKAELRPPYCVQLARPRELSPDECHRIDDWRPGGDWAALARSLRNRQG